MGALALVFVIIVVEYAARHLLAPTLPVLATPRVDDLVVAGTAYIVLSLVVMHVVGAQPGSVLRAVKKALGTWQAWVGAAVALLSAVLVGLLDHVLWGSVTLPSFSLPASSMTLAAGARWLEPASMMLVNGLVVPVAEEWLWRGVVQPRLVSRTGVATGIALTAMLFSAKHAVIDASMGRMLAITCAGVILGWVAHKATWIASALSHIMMNSVATAGVIIYGLFQSAQACAVPQPTLAPELQQATDRIAVLIDTRDRTEIEALFTPSFITSVTEEESLRVLESVHTMEGKCRFRCVVSLDGSRGATELLSCDHGTEWMRVHLEEGPSHRVDGLLMHPALVP